MRDAGVEGEGRAVVAAIGRVAGVVAGAGRLFAVPIEVVCEGEGAGGKEEDEDGREVDHVEDWKANFVGRLLVSGVCNRERKRSLLCGWMEFGEAQAGWNLYSISRR